MAIQAVSMVVPHIQTLFDGGPVTGLSDAQLIDRFVARRDRVGEAAFSALVERHGPMVLGLCRRLVGDAHLAEDAFQAVFLILARKAPSLRNPDLLGNWLYGVTIRTARDARRRQAALRESPVGTEMDSDHKGDDPTVESLITRESAELLHDEIDRLPRAFRLPIVLCYFEGLSLDAAAARLEWPQGTLRSRLARARDKLRIRLERRGVALSTAALATILGSRASAAVVSSSLCVKTANAAIARGSEMLARGLVSASVEALVRQSVRAAAFHWARNAGLAVLAMATIGGAAHIAGITTRGGRFDGHEAVPRRPTLRRQAVAKQEPPATQKAEADVEAKMTVVGRVVDPSGRPVAGASVDVVGRPRRPWTARDDGEHYIVLGSGRTEADGRFRFQSARASAMSYFEVYALAHASSFGLGWSTINPDAPEPTADLALTTERPIRGRVTDPDGRPVPGVSIAVRSVGRSDGVGGFDGVNLGIVPQDSSPSSWPKRSTSDEQGRFAISGTGRGATVRLVGIDGRYPHVSAVAPAEDDFDASSLALKFHRTAIVDGRVLAADTGLPLPHARLFVSTRVEAQVHGGTRRGSVENAPVETDDKGAFRAIVSAGNRYQVRIHPAAGQPYLVTETEEYESDGAEKELTKDLKLARGALIRGEVVESGTDKPLENAAVQYIPAQLGSSALFGWQSAVASAKDGSFEIAVPRGKGRLFVHGPTADYLIKEIGTNVVHHDRPGGERLYAHEILAYDATTQDAPLQIKAELRRGKIVRGRVEGPEGQAVDRAMIIALLQFNYFHLSWRGDLTQQVRDGRFELHGLDPEKPTRVMFLDSAHEWGATVELSGRQEGEDVTIRLQPCGRAEARFVLPDGKPVEGLFPWFEVLGSSGRSQGDLRPEAQGELAADGAYLPNLDRKHYWSGRFTDKDGRLILPDLIPGATYRITDMSTTRLKGQGPTVRRDFSVKSGEKLNLGEITVAMPPPKAQ